MKPRIVPAILAQDKKSFEQKLSLFKSRYNYIQIDVLDNTLVKNKSWFDLSKVKAKVEWEIHAMVARPEKYIGAWLKDKKIKSVVLHLEAYLGRQDDLCDIIELIYGKNRQVGLAINPSTNLNVLLPFVPLVDQVLVMGVEPGWSGQKFKKSALNRINKLRKLFPKLNIAVDGGVDENNLKDIVRSGANQIDSASMVLKMMQS